MSDDQIIARYIDAWNRMDVDALLELMHPGAAYYDAFWMETCVGRNLRRYFRDTMNEEPYRFAQTGPSVRTDHGVAFRYSAYDRSGAETDVPIFQGAEVLTIVDDKILTITDVYCSPMESDLLELAAQTANRHGLARHLNDGLGALKESRIRTDLSESINDTRCYLDPAMTMSSLAELVGCPVDQLVAVIEKHFDITARDFIDYQRVQHAKEVLGNNADDPAILEKIESLAGFRSRQDFIRQFTALEGMTPVAFLQKKKRSRRNSAPPYSN